MAFVLTVAGLLMALVAGVFLSFSDFVMRGLVQAPAGQGAAGMVGLNRTVYRSAFMVLLMGFVPGSGALAALAIWQLDGAARLAALAGTVAYLSGVMAVTGMGNVPMNTRLDALSRGPEGTDAYWPGYARGWTRLNHLRVAASTFAAAAWLSAAQLV
jgi:uncharacterized membrane protein